MTKVQNLRSLVEQRLTAAAEEIFGLFERTIAEYEEELCRTKENQRQRQILDDDWNPRILVHREGSSSDVHQQSVVKEEVPSEQQEWSPSLDQGQEPGGPESPYIKKEHEQLWTNQKGEQHQDLMQPRIDSGSSSDDHQQSVVKEEVPSEQQEWSLCLDPEVHEPLSIKVELETYQEAGLSAFSSRPFPVKSEDDDTLSSQLLQRETEENGEDRGGSEPTNSFNPHGNLQTQTKDSFQYDTDDCDFREETNQQQSDFKTKKVCQCRRTVNTDKDRVNLNCTGKKLLRCSLESKQCSQRKYLEPHAGIETKKKEKNVQVKEEPQDNWFSQGAEENDVKFPSDPVTMKNENDEEEVYFSTYHQRQTENRDAGVEAVKACKSDSSVDTDYSDENTSQVTYSTKAVIRTQHRQHKIKHLCPECGKIFYSKSTLKEHMYIHTGDRLFSCSVCEKRFTKSSYLVAHMKIHAAQKPFACSECGKKFVRKAHLLNHMKIHTGERPFRCSMCPKRFILKCDVKRHMSSHTGEKPFSCSVCHKRFTRKANLKTHMNLHTGEKPFSCSVCHKIFLNKNTIKAHMASHAENKLVCPLCGIKITHKSSVRRHMDRCHSLGGDAAGLIVT